MRGCMKKNIICLMALLIGAVSCDNKKDILLKENKDKQEEVNTVSPRIVVKPDDILEEHKARYRLNPDKRFLSAIGHVHSFFSGESIGEPMFSWNKEIGQWDIQYKQVNVGSLRDLADFRDFMSLLIGWAKVMAQRYPIQLLDDSNYNDRENVRQDLERFTLRDVANGLLQIDHLWSSGIKNPQMLKDVTQGLVAIVMQSMDNMEIADAMKARALAMLALTKALTSEDVSESEILLADDMQYTAYALESAKKLSADNPVCAYTVRDKAKLKEIAQHPKTSVLTRYLMLRLIAESEDIEEWNRWVGMYFQDDDYLLAVMKTAVVMDNFALRSFIVDFIAPLVLYELARDVGTYNKTGELIALVVRGLAILAVDIIGDPLSMHIEKILGLDSSSGIIKRLNSDKQQLKNKYKGQFLTPEFMGQYYESYLFSSLYIQGIFYLDTLSSIEGAKRFLLNITGDYQGIAEDFRRWYEHSVSAKAGNGKEQDMLEDIKTISALGTEPLQRTFEELAKFYTYGHPDYFKSLQELVKKMDARVYNRGILAVNAFDTIFDLNMAERMLKSAVEADPIYDESSKIWLALFSRNSQQLLEYAGSSMFYKNNRLRALGYLSNNDLASFDTIKNIFQKLLPEFTSDYDFSYSYAKFLKKNKFYDESRLVARAWIDLNISTTGLERLSVQDLIAEAYLEQGLFEEGLTHIKPFVSGQKQSTLSVAARLTQSLLRNKEAEELYKSNLERYPDSLFSLTEYLSFLWNNQRYEDAIKILQSWTYPLNAQQWRFKIGKVFSDVFAKKDVNEGISAFKLFINAGFKHEDLKNICIEMYKHGNAELAFKLNSLLDGKGFGRLAFFIDSYAYLKNWKGKEEALTWIKSVVPQAMRNQFSMMIFENSEFELLWDLIDNPEKGDGEDFVWLVRAAGWLREEKKETTYYSKLLDYFHKYNDTWYQKLGRYLLDLGSKEELFLLAGTNKQKICELAYYTGLKAQSEGDNYAACDWYQVCVGTGLINMGEYRWAFNQLYVWYTQGESLFKNLVIGD